MRRNSVSRYSGTLVAFLLAAAVRAGEPPAPASPGRQPAPEGVPGAWEKLSEALLQKEERSLDPALRNLEALAAQAGRIPQDGGGRSRGSDGLRSDSSPVLAAGLLADLEALDVRLRLNRLAGIDETLRRLEVSWRWNRPVRRRIGALSGLLPMRNISLLEPNAIATDRIDLGGRFRERFLAGRDKTASSIPLDLPIRHLTNLSIGPGKGSHGPRQRAVSIIGFLGAEDLAPGSADVWGEPVRLFASDPRVLLVLFAFTGEGEPPAARAGEEPWESAAVFWIRGTPETLASAPVRSGYEWLPGPTYFLLGPGGKIRSWRWPHEGWKGFAADVAEVLAEGEKGIGAGKP
jgi:hypothetical protein